MQKAFGLVYCPEGVLWNIFLRQVFSPVDQTYEDWLHSLYCSGGVAQHEVAHFVRSLEPDEKNIKAVLDNFQRQIIWANKFKLPPGFFQTRLPAEGHLKAFAVECMAAVDALAL